MNPVLSREKKLPPLKTQEGLPLPTLISAMSICRTELTAYVYVPIYLSLGLLAFGCELPLGWKAGWAVTLVCNFEYLMTYSRESTRALQQVGIYREERGVKATHINTIQDNTFAPVKLTHSQKPTLKCSRHKALKRPYEYLVTLWWVGAKCKSGEAAEKLLPPSLWAGWVWSWEAGQSWKGSCWVTLSSECFCGHCYRLALPAMEGMHGEQTHPVPTYTRL